MALKEFSGRWLKAMTASGVVRNITLTESQKVSTTKYSTWSRVITKRYAFVELRFIDRVSPVLFELTERRDTCHSAVSADEYSPTCNEEIEVKLSGPLASYERATPYDSLEQLFGGKQTVSFTYFPGDSKLVTAFSIKSLDFERSVLRMLQSRFAELTEAADVDVDQNLILTATARVLRNINEGVGQ